MHDRFPGGCAEFLQNGRQICVEPKNLMIGHVCIFCTNLATNIMQISITPNDYCYTTIDSINCNGNNNNMIMEFIQNCVIHSKEGDLLLPELSNIRVLIAEKNVDVEYTPWKDILTDEEYSKMLSNNGYIVAYMLYKNHQPNPNVKFISYIDTRVAGQNLASRLIAAASKDEEYYDRIILPYELIGTAVGYWKKWFKSTFFSKSELTVENLDYLLSIYELERDQVKWKFLYDILTVPQE